MSIEREYVNKFINEMATIGNCNGVKVSTHSKDHGLPHIHYGRIKIYLPKDLPKNGTILAQYVDNSQKDKISEQELSKLASWFEQRSTINPKLNNLETAWVAWNLEHPDD